MTCETFRSALAQLILPAFTLAIFSLAPIARMTRASMLAVLASDSSAPPAPAASIDRTVIVTYAFRNAMLPVVTTLGMVFSFLLGANVLVEKVFAWPGIGSYAVEALIASDFAPVQGFVLTHGGAVRRAQLCMIDILYWRDRSAREARRMTERHPTRHIAATIAVPRRHGRRDASCASRPRCWRMRAT